jgi:hypothetical protein
MDSYAKARMQRALVGHKIQTLCSEAWITIVVVRRTDRHRHRFRHDTVLSYACKQNMQSEIARTTKINQVLQSNRTTCSRHMRRCRRCRIYWSRSVVALTSKKRMNIDEAHRTFFDIFLITLLWLTGQQRSKYACPEKVQAQQANDAQSYESPNVHEAQQAMPS